MKTRGRLAAWEGEGGRSRSPPLSPPPREAGCLAGLVLGAWCAPQLEGWAGQASGGGCSWRGSEASRATAPLCPLGLPFKARKCCLGGDKTQIRCRPGSWEPGCGLVQGVRGARSSNQTGPSGQPPGGRLPDPVRVPPWGLGSGWDCITSIPSQGPVTCLAQG